MNIRIIQDIDDPDLSRSWKSIVEEYDLFPQSSYEWSASWWRHLGGKRELYIIAAVDDGDEIVGFAPLCIDTVASVKILRSFPVRSVDFYTFILPPDHRGWSALEIITDHMLKFEKWHLVRLDFINSEDPFYPFLLSRGFKQKKTSDIIACDLSEKTFEQYFRGLSKKRREELRKKRRNLERDARLVEFFTIQDEQGYLDSTEEIDQLYRARWKDLPSYLLGDAYQAWIKEAVTSCFRKKQGVLFLLKADGKLIAYKLGYVFKDAFYDWNGTFDLSYAIYSPGMQLSLLVTEELIRRGIAYFNFMTGDYEWKRSLAPGGKITTNYSLFCADRSLRGMFLLRYYMEWRNILRRAYKVIREKFILERALRIFKH
jgi:CelD/BcsL family acetyltransferase involved in cellulose biosynthesis